MTKNGNAGNYLSTMNEMFKMLEDACQPMYNDAKIATLLDGIKDTKYDVFKQIIHQDYDVTYEEVLGKLQAEELQLQLNTRLGPGRANQSGAQGRGGGQGGQQGCGQGGRRGS